MSTGILFLLFALNNKNKGHREARKASMDVHLVGGEQKINYPAKEDITQLKSGTTLITNLKYQIGVYSELDFVINSLNKLFKNEDVRNLFISLKGSERVEIEDDDWLLLSNFINKLHDKLDIEELKDIEHLIIEVKQTIYREDASLYNNDKIFRSHYTITNPENNKSRDIELETLVHENKGLLFLNILYIQ